MKTKFLLFIALCFTGILSKAQDSSSTEFLLKQIKVVKAVQANTNQPVAGLDEYIKVTVTDVASLQKIASAENKSIVLYFNEIPMHGIYGEFPSTKDNSLLFKLTRDTASLKSWNIFYQALKDKKIVSVSIGLENNGNLETKVNNFTLILVRQKLMYFAIAGFVVLLALFIVLVKKTGIIKDDNFMEHKGVYSLARTQLAFWTFIIIFSFLYVWIVTGELPPVTGSTIVLLSISMATTAGSKMIDSSKNVTPSPQDAISDGFFKDIISDYSGVSIHRFQMVVWTLILGIFFIRAVLKDFAMPQFEDSLLTLMGISSGAYLGLKIPEKAPETTTTATTTTTTSTAVSEPETTEENQDDTIPAVG